jgi:prepilin-type N-terminal cleavage/methylation domain-containing protein
VQRSNDGFSLVEAIVALVVLSLVFTAVWGWFGTAANSTGKIERAIALPAVFSQFVVNIELESLVDRTDGTYAVGDFEVEWRASIDRQSTSEPVRRQPAWIVTLYQIDANVNRSGRAVTSFSTKIVQQRRDPNYVDELDN